MWIGIVSYVRCGGVLVHEFITVEESNFSRERREQVFVVEPPMVRPCLNWYTIPTSRKGTILVVFGEDM